MNLETKRNGLVEYMKTMQVLRTKAVEKAFLDVKRESFVPRESRPQSYVDLPLPIGHYQTISQPTTIAIMLEMLNLKIRCDGGQDLRQALYTRIKQTDWILMEFKQETQSLEMIFRELTKEN